jgi:hypothetical protein
MKQGYPATHGESSLLSHTAYNPSHVHTVSSTLCVQEALYQLCVALSLLPAKARALCVFKNQTAASAQVEDNPCPGPHNDIPPPPKSPSPSQAYLACRPAPRLLRPPAPACHLLRPACRQHPGHPCQPRQAPGRLPAAAHGNNREHTTETHETLSESSPVKA